jgi:hypothetical protein
MLFDPKSEKFPISINELVAPPPGKEVKLHSKGEKWTVAMLLPLLTNKRVGVNRWSLLHNWSPEPAITCEEQSILRKENAQEHSSWLGSNAHRL